MTRALLAAVLLSACAEPGFMPTVPYWQRSDVPITLCVSAYSGDPGETDGARKLAAYALEQTFTLTSALTRPAALTRFSLMGTKTGQVINVGGGVGTVLQQTTVGQAVVDLSTNLGLVVCAIYTLTLRAAASGDNALIADGSVAGYAANTFLSGGLILNNVFVSQGRLALKNALLVRLTRVEFYFSLLMTFDTCANVILEGVFAAFVAVTATFDGDAVGAPTVQSGVYIGAGSKIGGGSGTAFITMSKQAKVFVDETSAVGGFKGSGLASNIAATAFPTLSCDGPVGGSNGGVIDFASAGAELPDTATVLTWDLRGSKLWCDPWGNFGTQSVVTTAKFKVGGAAAHFQTVSLDSVRALPATTFTADAAIHMTCRGATQPSAVYTTPGANGDIIPPMLTGTVDISAGGAVAKTWVQLGYAGLIRTGAACDTAFLTESAAASDPFIAAKATTGLTITSAVVAGDTACNWLAIWK